MRAVIALDGSPLHTVAVINLLRLVDHRTSLDRMTVGFYLLLSRGPSVGLEIVFFCDSHLLWFHSLLFFSVCLSAYFCSTFLNILQPIREVTDYLQIFSLPMFQSVISTHCPPSQSHLLSQMSIDCMNLGLYRLTPRP